MQRPCGYHRRSRFPASRPWNATFRFCFSLGIPELAGVAPVEIFRGGPVTSGRYSLLVRTTFQSQQATLTEEQLAAYSARIVENLERKLGAQIRMGGEGRGTE